jgi:hypothetical protein
MRQDEDRNVVGRIVAPPTLPGHIRPRAANRPEHVSPEDPGAHASGAPRSEIVIDPVRATVLVMHLPPTAGANDPVMQGLAAHAERIFNTLIRARSVAIKRDGEALNSNSRHRHASVWIAAHEIQGLDSDPRLRLE